MTKTMNRFYTILIACIGTILILPTLPSCSPTDADSNNQTDLIASQLSSAQLYQLAESITVKVLTANNSASGILISKQGQQYTVLTNAHVITSDSPYRIQTSDRQIHEAKLINKGDSLQGDDLAILQFTAAVDYPVASTGSGQNLALKQKVLCCWVSL